MHNITDMIFAVTQILCSESKHLVGDNWAPVPHWPNIKDPNKRWAVVDSCMTQSSFPDLETARTAAQTNFVDVALKCNYVAKCVPSACPGKQNKYSPYPKNPLFSSLLSPINKTWFWPTFFSYRAVYFIPWKWCFPNCIPIRFACIALLLFTNLSTPTPAILSQTATLSLATCHFVGLIIKCQMKYTQKTPPCWPQEH